MDDLLSEFLAETQDNMDELDIELVKFEQNPQDEETLSKIFRMVHTIKGTCGFLNLPRLEHISHAAETLLSQFRAGKIDVSVELITLVLQSLDRIKMILGNLADTETEPEGDDNDLIEQLQAASAIAEEPAAPVPPVAFESIQATSDAIFDSAPVTPITPEPAQAVPAAPVQPAPPPPAPPAQEFADLNDDSDGDDEDEMATNIMSQEQHISNPRDVLVNDELQEPDTLPTQKGTPPAKTGGQAPAQAQGAGEHKNIQNSIKVSVDLLENLMTMVSELVLTRNQLLQLLRNREDTSFTTPLQRLNLITSELQEGVMKTRMQPIGNAWNKLPRLIRDLNHELGKNINLKMIGAETELDRQVLEMIKDPLLHMVRNSADHGVESPQQRINVHKAEQGTITLNAYHEGGHIIIEISDDGAGIDTDRVRRKIVEQGILSTLDADALNDSQLNSYIFHPGFSTAQTVSAVSGRGVGMDVVKTNIDKIGGTIELHSTMGRGTTVIIKIPLTLAIVQALIVNCGRERFAIPQISVVELVNVTDTSEHRIELIQRTPVLRLRNRLLPLLPLRKVLGIDPIEKYTKTDIHRIALQMVNQEAMHGFVADQTETDNKNQDHLLHAENPTHDEEMPSPEGADDVDIVADIMAQDTIKNDGQDSTDSPDKMQEESQYKSSAVTSAQNRFELQNKTDERMTAMNENRQEEELRRAVESLGDASLSEIESQLNLAEKRQVGRYLQIMHSIGGTMNNYIVVTKVGANYFGIIVELVNDTEEIVVKPTGRIIREIPYFSGNTILGDGSVIMIIDPNGVGRMVGDIQMTTGIGEEEQDSEGHDHSRMTLLLFRSNEGAKKAVPLGVVARLEEIDLSKVEYPNNQPAVQYREKLMPLVTLDNEAVPDKGRFPVLVFSDNQHSMGLIVQEINDIVEERLEVQMTTNTPGVVGSTIINGEATDIIDPEFYWKAAFTEQLGHDLYINSISKKETTFHKVLLVDANDVYRDLVVPYLSASGHRVTSVNSVEEAQELLQRQIKFDAIVADIDSFGEEIFSFTSKVRESRGIWATLPILAVTTSVHSIDTEAGYIAGFTDFIVKSDKRALIQSLLMFKT